MRTENAKLMLAARESLKDKWGLAVGVVAVYLIVLGLLQDIKDIGPLASLLVSGPLAGGLAIFFLTMSRGGEVKFEQLFDGFRSYSTYLVASLLMLVYVFLWALLLIVPGIIAAISYSMTYYIIADDKTVSASDALKRSRELMNGNKGRYFFLMLRFIGWAILSILSFGIGFLWLLPYIQVSTAKLYDDIRGDGPRPVAVPAVKGTEPEAPEAAADQAKDAGTEATSGKISA